MRGSERTRHVPIIFVTAGAREPQRAVPGLRSRRGRLPATSRSSRTSCATRPTSSSSCYRQQQQLAARAASERTETLRLNEMFTAVLGARPAQPAERDPDSAAQLLERQHRRRRRCATRGAAHRRRAGRRMSRMIDDMLDLTRARLGGGIPLRRAADRPAAAGRPRGRREQRAIIPSADEVALHVERRPARRVGRRPARRRSLSNLVGNALPHGEPRTGAVEVRLDGSAADRVRISGQQRRRDRAPSCCRTSSIRSARGAAPQRPQRRARPRPLHRRSRSCSRTAARLTCSRRRPHHLQRAPAARPLNTVTPPPRPRRRPRVA